MAKGKKKRKNSAASAQEKALLRQERAEIRAKQNRKALWALGGLIICVALLLAIVVGMGSTGRKYNLEKFEQLESGMTYSEVADLMGADGDAVNETDSTEEASHAYSWTNGDGSGITVVFDENDSLVVAYSDGLDED